MKLNIHDESVCTSLTTKKGVQIVRWGLYADDHFTEDFADELQVSIQNGSMLPLTCRVEPGIFIMDNPQRGVQMYSDAAVPTRLYYSVQGDTLYLAHTDKKAAEMMGTSDKIDYAGLYQRFTYGSTIGPRTRYDGVFVLEPGSIVSIGANGKIERSFITFHKFHRVDVGEIWEALCDAVSGYSVDRVGLMLSGGYDSRILLAACRERKIPLDSVYTHGLHGSNELQIAYMVAKHARVKRIIQVDAMQEMYGSADELKSFFEELGILYMSFWRLAGKYFQSRNAVPICGVQAETLNGQYLNGLLLGSYSRPQRYMIGLRGYGAYVKSSSTFSDFCRKVALPVPMKYFRPELRGNLDGALEITRDDLARLGDAYRSSCDSWEDVFERFLCDHDGSKLMAQQSNILRMHVPAITPYTNRRVHCLSFALDDRKKPHGSAMREILRLYAKDLAKYKCSKSFLPAYFPDAAHLVFRTLRSLGDRRRIKQFLSSNGVDQKGLEKNSWVGGDVWVRNGNQIEEFRRLLSGNILVKEFMRIWLDKIAGYEIALGDGNDLFRFIEMDLLQESIGVRPLEKVTKLASA
ncbi:MAG TPA: asparagine synthase-related protein [Deltaproteobacteria bacterium]|jgi:hypothetical protein|nr:asparagine synthase-related protein [Deltaproteobacteria bacterium]HQI02707.1 asparagine synthase-related protein [Deltaproteobacteria bacterium]HQJ09297.1 asparagine synthase-related protein [Deltaproteobacteria bacterium]